MSARGTTPFRKRSYGFDGWVVARTLRGKAIVEPATVMVGLQAGVRL